MATGIRRLYASGAIQPPQKVEAICHTCKRVVGTLKIPRFANAEFGDRAAEIAQKNAEVLMSIAHRGHETQIAVHRN